MVDHWLGSSDCWYGDELGVVEGRLPKLGMYHEINPDLENMLGK